MNSLQQLSGFLIVNTRPQAQASGLSSRLTAAGAEVLEVPLLEIQTQVGEEDVKHFAALLGPDDWMLCTSANAFHGVSGAINEFSCRIGVIGQKTAMVAMKYGRAADFIAKNEYAEGMLEELLAGQYLASAKRIVVAVGSSASTVLEDGLADTVEVHRWEIYRSVPREVSTSEFINLAAKILDTEGRKRCIIALSSSSAAKHWHELLQRFAKADEIALLPHACIGEKVASTLVSLGFPSVCISQRSSDESLVELCLEIARTPRP